MYDELGADGTASTPSSRSPRSSAMIKYFYYYEMRGEPGGFDSGLLEERPTKEGEETYNKKPASAPRDIYSVYKNKGPKS
jgi:hypothetical protein